MEAINWLCATCGCRNSSIEKCGVCSSGRPEAYGSSPRPAHNNRPAHDNRPNRGNVFHIHAPTQFNGTQEPEWSEAPVPYIDAPVEAPKLDPVKVALGRVMYGIGTMMMAMAALIIFMVASFLVFIFYKAYLAGMA